MCFSNDVTYLIKLKNKDLVKCNYVERYLSNNNIPFVIKYIDDFTMKDTKGLVEMIKTSFYDEDDCDICNIMNLLYTQSAINSRVSLYNLDVDNISIEQLLEIIHINRKKIKLPIVCRNGISVIGFYGFYEDYQQFLVGKERDNIKWLGGNPDYTDEEKVAWIINNLGLPKQVTTTKKYNKDDEGEEDCKLYMPQTSMLYGGVIKWTFPSNLVTNSGYILMNNSNRVKKIPIKMSVKVGNIHREKEFLIKVC